jgi:DNA sulfur modification protein DndC
MNPIKNEKANGIIAEIIEWIIGFSCGKKSTVLLMLVWITLQRFRLEIPFSFQLKVNYSVIN